MKNGREREIWIICDMVLANDPKNSGTFAICISKLFEKVYKVQKYLNPLRIAILDNL